MASPKKFTVCPGVTRGKAIVCLGAFLNHRLPLSLLRKHRSKWLLNSSFAPKRTDSLIWDFTYHGGRDRASSGCLEFEY